jgi:actin-related protein
LTAHIESLSTGIKGDGKSPDCYKLLNSALARVIAGIPIDTKASIVNNVFVTGEGASETVQESIRAQISSDFQLRTFVDSPDWAWKGAQLLIDSLDPKDICILKEDYLEVGAKICNKIITAVY